MGLPKLTQREFTIDDCRSTSFSSGSIVQTAIIVCASRSIRCGGSFRPEERFSLAYFLLFFECLVLEAL